MSERYRIVRSLGSGGMAEVFLALARGAEGFEKPVVIKRLHPHLARHDQTAQMFLSEARLSMHLHHQNVVQVMDVGRGPEGLYLVMELVNGWDLSVLLGHARKTGRPMPEALAGFLASQVAAGLAHAFRRTRDGKRLLEAHRDISPSNILVTAEGEVKVADFGIARIDGAQLTEPGSFKGKVPFAAPEVVRGIPATPASDQFSLGVVLYRLLGQGHPYGYRENLVQYAELLAQAGPPRVDFVSPPFQRILLRLLALRPEDRFPSWDEVADAFGGYLAQAGTQANPSALTRYLATLDLPPPPLEGPLTAEPMAADTGAPDADFGLQPEFIGGGAVLDASGRLSEVHAPEPVPQPIAVASTRLDAGDRFAPPPTPEAPEEPIIDALPIGATPVSAAPGALELAHPPGATAAPAMPIDHFQPLPQRYDTGRRRSTLFPAAVVLFLLLVAGAAGWVLLRGGLPKRLLPESLRPEPATLTIDSTPGGAVIYVDGRELGETPLARENDFAPGAVLSLRLVKPGYQPWTGTIVGGRTAHVEAKLRRR